MDPSNNGAEYHSNILKMIKMFQDDSSGSLKNYFIHINDRDILSNPLHMKGEMKIHDMFEFDSIISMVVQNIELKSRLTNAWYPYELEELIEKYSKTGVDTIELTHLSPLLNENVDKFADTLDAIRGLGDDSAVKFVPREFSDLWNYPLDVESKELVHEAINHSIGLHPQLSEAYTFYLQNNLFFIEASNACASSPSMAI